MAGTSKQFDRLSGCGGLLSTVGLLQRGIAPGYVLECLTYNVPNSLFVADDAARLAATVEYLHALQASDLQQLMWSCDNINKLFVTDPGRHSAISFASVINVLWGMV